MWKVIIVCAAVVLMIVAGHSIVKRGKAAAVQHIQTLQAVESL